MNIILSILAAIVLVAGIISLVTPVPGGTLFIAIGLTALICTNHKAQLCIRYFRGKVQTFNKIMRWIEDKIGKRINFIGDALARTRPEFQDNQSEQ